MELLLAAKITSPHGIKGLVKISPNITLQNYQKFYDKDANPYQVKFIFADNKIIFAQINGIKSRNEAEKLRGREIFIAKDDLLSLSDEEFYYQEMAGLKVIAADNQDYGTVIAIHNFGAGDILEIKLADSGKNEMLHFSKANFPSIDKDNGIIHVIPPEIT